MKHASDPTGKGISFYGYLWRFSFVAGLCVCALVVGFSAGSVSSPSAFDASVLSSQRTFSVSPTQGPVGAVIVVSSGGTFLSDGTQISLGYVSADGSTCHVVSGGQAGVVRNHAFSGWFRWPASTGKGSFGVCIEVEGSPYRVGTYTVLSATPARVTVSPTTPDAGKQATVSGANFLPAGTSVNLFWRSAHGGQSISLGSVSSGSGRPRSPAPMGSMPCGPSSALISRTLPGLWDATTNWVPRGSLTASPVLPVPASAAPPVRRCPCAPGAAARPVGPH